MLKKESEYMYMNTNSNTMLELFTVLTKLFLPTTKRGREKFKSKPSIQFAIIIFKTILQIYTRTKPKREREQGEQK